MLPVQDKDSEKKRVSLMGPPRVTALVRQRDGRTREEAQRISQDDDAMEMLALLVLSRAFLSEEAVKTGGEVRRDWLAAKGQPGRHAALPVEERKAARDRSGYLLDKLKGKLDISTFQGTREPVVFHATLKNLCVDVLEVAEAGRQLHVPKNQEDVIALADRPLLDGMAYPWLAEPAFQRARAELDDHYLMALWRKAGSLIFQMEQASAQGKPALVDTYRNEALPLLDKAAERLRDYGQHPLAPKFSDLRTRAAYPVSEEIAPHSAVPPRLLLYVTSFIGRVAERAKIKALLTTERLVTLTGMGGCGKTRLAWQAASELADGYPDGVWPVELASVTDSTLVPSAVAAAFGVERRGNVTQSIVSVLQSKRALLLLDNCEHLREACAELVQTLIQSCPDLRVLATSRQPLNIDGEHPYRISPLAHPEHLPTDGADPIAALMAYDAVQLFLDRVRPFQEFALGTQNMISVAAICKKLDGIPLALELAAAQMRTLSVAQIAEMLADRFQLLTGGRSTTLARHKTLRAVIDWSYDLLTEPEQALLCRVSVFTGGWTLEATQAVAAADGLTNADILPLLNGLIDKSLVVAEIGDDSSRYRMLETVRQYAQDRLRERGEWDDTRLKHRDFYLHLAEEADAQLRGPNQKQWFERLEAEINDIREALGWRADEAGLRLACTLSRFWVVRGYLAEGRKWLERELDGKESASEELAARAFIAAGRLAYAQGQLAEAINLYEQGLALHTRLGNKRGIADALFCLACVAEHQGSYQEAIEKHQESLKLFTELADERGTADALYGLGIVYQNQDNYLAAGESHQKSLALRRKLGDVLGIAISLSNLGRVAFYQGRFGEAEAFFQDSYTRRIELGEKRGIASCLGDLADIAQARGENEEGCVLLRRGFSLHESIGNRSGAAEALAQLAAIAYYEEQYEEAGNLYRQSLTFFEAQGDVLSVAMLSSNLGSVALMQGRHQEARELLRESLAKFCHIGEKQGAARSLQEFARLAVAQGENQRAAILGGASEALADSIGYVEPPNERIRYDQAISEMRAALGEEVFAAAWAEGQAMTWEQAVASAW